jgi:hypothetical protein
MKMKKAKRERERERMTETTTCFEFLIRFHHDDDVNIILVHRPFRPILFSNLKILMEIRRARERSFRYDKKGIRGVMLIEGKNSEAFSVDFRCFSNYVLRLEPDGFLPLLIKSHEFFKIIFH